LEKVIEILKKFQSIQEIIINTYFINFIREILKYIRINAYSNDNFLIERKRYKKMKNNNESNQKWIYSVGILKFSFQGGLFVVFL
jgi:hypothetical protein